MGEEQEFCGASPHCRKPPKAETGFCPQHWEMLPRRMKVVIWLGWDRDRGGEAHQEAVKRASEWIRSALAEDCGDDRKKKKAGE